MSTKEGTCDLRLCLAALTQKVTMKVNKSCQRVGGKEAQRVSTFQLRNYYSHISGLKINESAAPLEELHCLLS